MVERRAAARARSTRRRKPSCQAPSALRLQPLCHVAVVDRACGQAEAPQPLDGSVAKTQRWKIERPDAVTVDQRAEEWKKPKLNRQLKNLNSPYKMWVGAPALCLVACALFRASAHMPPRRLDPGDTGSLQSWIVFVRS